MDLRARSEGTAPDLEQRLLAQAPLFRAWADYLDRVDQPFTIPGHQRRAASVSPLLARMLDSDVPLFGGLDTVNLDGGVLRSAEKRAAAQWGADWCRYSTGGSTHANQAVLLGALRPGQTVLVTRSAHRSTLLGIVLTGARPVWLPVDLDAGTGLPVGVSRSTVRAALTQHPDAAAAVLVEPSYVGVSSPDLAAIIADLSLAGVPVLVDQAWGAHLGFHPGYPPHALELGADALVTSAHKALPAFSQGAILLARCDRLSAERLERGFEATNTTSPAGAVLASTDAARALLAQPEGRDLLDRAASAVDLARTRLRAAGFRVPGPEDFPTRTFDPAKLVVLRGEPEQDLRVVAAHLARLGMPVEMADRDTLVPMVGLLDPGLALDALVIGVLAVDFDPVATDTPFAHVSAWTSGSLPPPRQVLSPRDAFFAAHEDVPAARAVGRVSAEVVAPYPPGVPVLVPGEEISADTLELLREAAARGTRIAYASDPGLATFSVVAE